MTVTLKMSDSVAGTLRIACEIAAERFDGYATEIANERVADQFRKQAAEMREAIELIDRAS